MFEKGEYIICGNNGICCVEDIGTIDLDDINPDRLYYSLKPVFGHTSAVYVPVDNDKIVMRKILTKEQAEDLIQQIPSIELIGEPNDRRREERIKECMRQQDCIAWAQVIKTLYKRRSERIAKGQKVTATDARYLKTAEDNLYGEFSMALGIPKEEVLPIILEQIGE